MSVIDRAFLFASNAHGAINHRRKYTNEPYIAHPLEVVDILRHEGITDENMLAAAFLHDVVEDTPVTIEQVHAEFGFDIANLVAQLTDISSYEDGNREERKRIDLMHTALSDTRAQTIKLADLISNTTSIVEHDPKFAAIYLREKLASLSVLYRGHPRLWMRAHHAALVGLRKLEQLNEPAPL